MRKCSTPVQYIIDGEKKILVLCRYENQEHTLPCPFCNKTHRHGTEDGHREAHCYNYRSTRETVTAPDGSVINRRDGYDVVTIPDTATLVIDFDDLDMIMKFINLKNIKYFHIGEFSTVKERLKALRNYAPDVDFVIVYHLNDLIEPGANPESAIDAVNRIAAKTQKTYLILKKLK